MGIDLQIGAEEPTPKNANSMPVHSVSVDFRDVPFLVKPWSFIIRI